MNADNTMSTMKGQSNYRDAADSVLALAADKPLTDQQRLGLAYFALLGMMTQRLADANTTLKPELIKMCDRAGRAAEGLNYA